MNSKKEKSILLSKHISSAIKTDNYETIILKILGP